MNQDLYGRIRNLVLKIDKAVEAANRAATVNGAAEAEKKVGLLRDELEKVVCQDLMDLCRGLIVDRLVAEESSRRHREAENSLKDLLADKGSYQIGWKDGAEAVLKALGDEVPQGLARTLADIRNPGESATLKKLQAVREAVTDPKLSYKQKVAKVDELVCDWS